MLSPGPHGHNAIVVLWDENDYSLAPNKNRVMTIVDTNYGLHQTQSGQFYCATSNCKLCQDLLGLLAALA